MEKKQWRIAAAVAFVVMLVLNGLAGSTTLLGGKDTAAVSDAYPTLFTPAGFTFAIWGVIYLLLAGFVAYQLGWFGKQSSQKRDVTDALMPDFTLSSVVNSVWILSWQYNVLWLSVVLMVVLLWLLIRINLRLYKLDYSAEERLLIKAPFSVYFGWISVATVANISVWLVSVQWDGLGLAPETWLSAVLVIATAIGLATTFHNHDCAYGAVFVWAFFGILAKHLGMAQINTSIVSLLAVLLVVLAFSVGYVLRDNKDAVFGKKLRLFRRS